MDAITNVAMILQRAITTTAIILYNVVITIAIILQKIITTIVMYIKRVLPVLMADFEAHTRKSYEKLPDSWEKVTDGSYSVRKHHKCPIFPMFYTLLTAGFYLVQSQLMMQLY